MRTTRRILFSVLAVVGLLASACAADTTGDDLPVFNDGIDAASGPSLRIASPQDRAHIRGNVVTLKLDVTHIKIVKADGDASGATGHFHVFVDKEPVAVGKAIPTEAGVIHSADDPIIVPGLSLGNHKLSVVVGDGRHKRLNIDADRVSVHIDGPALRATAPATLAAGSDLSINVAVAGVTLVGANGDTTGATGHLHAFVDVAPVAPGALIPFGNPAIIHTPSSPIIVKGLAAGEHTIWIVLGNGTHHAFRRSVRDKVTVTVT